MLAISDRSEASMVEVDSITVTTASCSMNISREPVYSATVTESFDCMTASISSIMPMAKVSDVSVVKVSGNTTYENIGMV